MNCSWIEKVSLLIDGELPSSALGEVERHLAGCGECQQVRNDFLSFRNQLSNYELPLAAVSTEAALARILDSTDQPVAIKTPVRRFTLGTLFNPRVAAFAAVLILGLLASIAVYRTLRHAEENNFAITNHGPRATPVTPLVATPQQSPSPQEIIVGVERPDQQPVIGKKEAPRNMTTRPNVITNAPVRTAQESVAEVQSPVVNDATSPPVRSADAQTLTAMHFEKAELLLRAFRNVRLSEKGVGVEVGYEKKKAQQLVYQNMMLRREADSTGDVQVSSLLENLEPILIDIANLPDKPGDDDIRIIRDRVEKKNIVALLQVNSTALARALD